MYWVPDARSNVTPPLAFVRPEATTVPAVVASTAAPTSETLWSSTTVTPIGTGGSPTEIGAAEKAFRP